MKKEYGKKLYRYLLIPLILLLLLMPIKANATASASLKAKVNETIIIKGLSAIEEIRKKELEKKAEIEEILDQMIYEATENKDYVKEVRSNFLKIDESLLLGLGEVNAIIFLVDYPITDLFTFHDLKGVVPRGYEGTGKTWDDVVGATRGRAAAVNVPGARDTTKTSAPYVEIHEIAHVIDSTLLKEKGSSSSEFKELMRKESRNLFPNDIGYVTLYPEEYFAEAFSLYVMEENKVKSFAPKTHTFFDNLIKEYRGQ